MIAQQLHRNEAPSDSDRHAWQVGGIVYQIFVDRFAPSARLAEKASLYSSPRRLLDWGKVPQPGKFIEEERNHSAELDFWGGDLRALAGRLDYLQELGVEVVYLNPIFEAYTNHKYDATDYRRVDPQYGTNEDFRALVEDIHARGMRIILDGVFNHMGRRSPLFLRAQQNPNAPEREFFTFHESLRHGYLSWRNSTNLPELKLENPAVAEYLFRGDDSIARHWIREYGIDGWRLDVAPDIGFQYLAEITRASHETRHGTVVIGECWNYPEDWLHVLDGILNMFNRNMILEMIAGKLPATSFARIWGRMLADCSYPGLLRSHLVLDNHDVPRLATLVPDFAGRAICRALQFTLPGCPVIYYGSELGMEGGADPTNRAPMRWDLLEGENPDLADTRRLIDIRRHNPALRDGLMRVLDSDRVLAFLRRNEDPRQTIVVVANPTHDDVLDIVPIRDSRLMDAAPLECLLSGERVVVHSGLLSVHLPARSVRIFRSVDRGGEVGYSMFKRSKL